MLFLPPHTVEAKVVALRWHLPGVNLRKFLKGMPTALARSQETVPRGLNQLRKVSRVFYRHRCVVLQDGQSRFFVDTDVSSRVRPSRAVSVLLIYTSCAIS